MEHTELIAAYAEKYALDNLRLNHAGLAVLDLGEGMGVYLESQSPAGTLLLQTPVGRTPVDNVELLRRFLFGNIFYRGGTGIITAMDPCSYELLLIVALSGETLTLDCFEEALENLVFEAEQWRDVFRTNAPAAAPHESDELNAAFMAPQAFV